MKLPRELEIIAIQMRNEGYVDGTPAFDYIFLKRKIEKCQELRSANDCRTCSYFDHCEMAKSYLRQSLEFQRQAAAAATQRKKEAHQRAAASIGHVLPMVAMEEKKDD